MRVGRRGETCQTYWSWTVSGLLRAWGEGGCLTSVSGQGETLLTECDPEREDQVVEAGLDVDVGGENKIAPVSEDMWRARAESRRVKELEISFLGVQEVLTEIRELNKTGELWQSRGHRRAVVFYIDKDSHSLIFFTWWIHAWRITGLDSPTESFDLILFTHPQTVSSLDPACLQIRDGQEPGEFQGGGRCLYRVLLPFSERNIKFYNHLNSLECLYNMESSAFLRGYKTLLRADLDTFPTPALVGYWPEDLVAYRGAGTTHHLESIEGAIRRTAAAAGIQHQHWHNIDSSLMGPSLRVIMAAKLTTAVARFTRAHMFGPGTVCRCSTCSSLPEECIWGKGIW